MNYWLVKSEPDAYSWDDFQKDKKTVWDGVRNYQARNNLNAMKKGDLVFFYHSNEGKAIVGIAKVTKEAFPDPKDKEWTAVELGIEKKLKRPVALPEIKTEKNLAEMTLVRTSRLSVQSVKPAEFDFIIALSEQK